MGDWTEFAVGLGHVLGWPLVLGPTVWTAWYVWGNGQSYLKPWPKRRPSNWKAAKAAEPLAGYLSSRRATRTKAHNEWLLMWYNALPEDKRNHFENVWAEQVMQTKWMMNATGTVGQYERVRVEFFLKCASNMVDAVLNPSQEIAKVATDEVDGSLVVGHVRADRIRSASMLDGPAAVGVPVVLTSKFYSDKEQRREVFGAKVVDKACCTCGCGPNDAC